MPSTKTPDTRPNATREEKVEEILAILGELHQRFGIHQAGPTSNGVASPEYRFVGYRPYSMPNGNGVRQNGMQFPVTPQVGMFG